MCSCKHTSELKNEKKFKTGNKEKNIAISKKYYISNNIVKY